MRKTACIRARGGRRGGNVLGFVALMEGCPIRDAALKLSNWFDVQSDGGRASPSDENQRVASQQLVAKERRGQGEVTNIDTRKSAENKPLGFALTHIDHSHRILPPAASRRRAQCISALACLAAGDR
jgi:hypothetical protein